jgi:hypothetical protein
LISTVLGWLFWKRRQSAEPQPTVMNSKKISTQTNQSGKNNTSQSGNNNTSQNQIGNTNITYNYNVPLPTVSNDPEGLTPLLFNKK